ncbi:MAG: DUF6496 domain-containing protein [Terriglobales bacterium]
MPEKRTLDRVRKDRREGKPGTTQAGEFVREEFDHVRRGKHGAKSRQQAIAIGLSKARRAGVAIAPPKAAKASSRTRKKAQQDLAKGRATARSRAPQASGRRRAKAARRQAA